MHNKNRKSLQQRSGNKVKLIYSFSYFVLIIGCYYLLKSGNEEMPIFSFDSNSYQVKQAEHVLPKGQWLLGTTIAYPNSISYMQVGGNEWIEMTEG